MNKITLYLKNLRYIIEAILAKFGLTLFKILSLKAASNFGGLAARSIGKFLAVHKLARANLSKAMPDLNDCQIKQILDDMWDNLGRIIGEFIHVCQFSGKQLMQYIKVSDQTLENIKYIKKNCHGGIIFSGHIGNWEIGPKFFLEQGIKVKTVYRPLNNKLVDDMTALIRGTKLIAKSLQGSREIIKEIKKGNYIIILIDQKVTDGVPIKFFNRPAVTTLSIAKLALRYNVPLIPVRIIRIDKKFQFQIEVEKPIEFKKKDGIINDSAVSLMTKVNQKLENWIKEYPSQWFWVHNRWKK